MNSEAKPDNGSKHWNKDKIATDQAKVDGTIKQSQPPAQAAPPVADIEEDIAPAEMIADEKGEMIVQKSRVDNKTLTRTLGAKSRKACVALLLQARGTSHLEDIESAGIGGWNETLASIYEIAPKNHLEGMIALEVVTMHNLAMKYSKMALTKGNYEFSDSLIEKATKCARMVSELSGALNKLRGNGNQTITVKKVIVNEGGQAIVGNVNPQGNRGLGGSNGKQVTPHAPR